MLKNYLRIAILSNVKLQGSFSNFIKNVCLITVSFIYSLSQFRLKQIIQLFFNIIQIREKYSSYFSAVKKLTF